MTRSRSSLPPSIAVLTSLLLAVVGPSETSAGGDRLMTTGSGQPPAAEAAPWLGPEVAVAREFDILVARNSREALMLFITRHGDHPLADRARAMLAGTPFTGDPSPDAAVYADYNRALQAGTAAALGSFIAEHSDHPLAAEARRQLR